MSQSTILSFCENRPDTSPAIAMQILHVSAGNLFGGVETLLVTLARCRDSCPEMDPQFALSFEGKVAESLRQTSVPVHVLGQVRVSRPWTMWRARQELDRLILQTRIDLVICHSAWPHVVFGPVVRRIGIPLVTWIHEPVRGTHWVERWARRTPPDFVVCNSQFTACALKNLFPHVGFNVVYCPVAIANYPFQERSQVRQELSTPKDTVVVIQVSRLETWKGHFLHLEALGKLRNDLRWTAWFVGGAQRPQEASYLAELKSRAAKLNIADRVRFLGQRSDVPRLLAAADIHCQPNTGPEPFGITFVEGMLGGLPVVTTAMGGALEILNNSCGILVPPGNADALAASLKELIQNPLRRRQLGRNGPDRAKNLCDPARQMAQLHSQCRRVLQESIAA
jgi:glycosyltransferase involved in cell wall biosynthesis